MKMSFLRISMGLIILIFVSLPGCKDRKNDEHGLYSKEKKVRMVKDCLERTVTIPLQVEKIVDLASADGTRSLLKLGAIDKLIAINNHVTDYMFGEIGKKYGCWLAVPKVAPQIKELISVGNYLEPNTELLISLEPDVIFVENMSFDRVNALQEQTGIPVICIRASGALDFKMLQVVAEVVGENKRAEELIAYAQRKIQFIRDQTNSISKTQKVKVFYWVPPVLGAPRTISPYDPIDIAGGINLGDHAAVHPYEAYETTAEQIAVWNPDIILLHWWSKADVGVKLKNIARDPVLQTVRAVKNNQIFYSRGFFLGWDPALGLCELYYMARLFYPERFKKLDVEKEGNEIMKMFYGRDGLYTDLLQHSELHRWN